MAEKKEKSEAEEKVEKEEETKADTPKWAIELGAKIDKLAEVAETIANVKKQMDEEKPKEDETKPKEEQKQDEAPAEPTPEEACKANGGEWVDGECKMPEETPTEEKTEKKLTEADVTKMVEKRVKELLKTDPIKKSKVPTSETDEVLTYNKITKMSWADVEKTAESMGALGRRI